MKSRIIGILLIISLILTSGCIDRNHTPNVDIESKIFNDELKITLIAKENYNNLKLDVQSEKLSIAPFESEILSPIDIDSGEELIYNFKITNPGYERGEKLKINIFLIDQNYNSRNIKTETTTYSPGQIIPGFEIFTSLILLIFLIRLIKIKGV